MYSDIKSYYFGVLIFSDSQEFKDLRLRIHIVIMVWAFRTIMS